MKVKVIHLLAAGLFVVTACQSSDVFAGSINVVNVKAYGALGDGVTDDTTAIRNAINAAASGTLPRVVFFPAGRYVISKPIFIGVFVSSGNWQGSFSWAGETRYWGGGIAYAKEGLHLVGETSDNSNLSEIVFKRTDGVSCPMIIIIGGRDFKIEKMQLNGQYVTDDPTYTRASEGIFHTAGTYGFTLEQSVIKNCKRGYRGGNGEHWPEDPITFTNYETQNDYPITFGGWMVEQVVFIGSRILNCDICISQESAQTIGFQVNNVQIKYKAGGYGVYLHSGRMTMIECSFMGASGVADIYVPPWCLTNFFQVLGGHSESQGAITFKKDRVSAYSVPAQYAFKQFETSHNMEIYGAAYIIIDGGSFKNIDLLTNADVGSGALQIVDIKNCRISGKVGQKSNAYASAAKVVFSAENTIFSGAGSITTPFNSYFDAHSVNKIENCRFTGSNFTSDVIRLNYQGMGVFSRAADGDSHFSLGDSYSNTNVIYGDQDFVATLINAYRKDGSLYAASTTGSKLVQGNTSLAFSVFSGDTADTAVDSWNEKFAVGANGGIWTTKIDGHRMGWNNTAPTSGTWSQGDVILNSSATAGGTQGWICVVGGTPGTWDIIAF